MPIFTFQMSVALAMIHFPWLRFHMDGLGRYEPGQTYVVHFAKLPWFAPRHRYDVDLSMLDPAMWPKRFTYRQIGQQNEDTLFELHAINDPTLKSAVVALSPGWCARHLDATYDDGTRVSMSVSFSAVNGFMVPVTLQADIAEPHLALSANADFAGYTFGQQPLAGEVPP
ncbi:MAG: hypothetical protein WA814_02780 [Candidatus Baltobacteraceae bacterium]